MLHPLAGPNQTLGEGLAHDISATFDKVKGLGISALTQDLATSQQYDHENPKGKYEEKNLYFDRANFIGIPLLQKGITGLSKIYYWQALNTINEFENSNQRQLNKGMVCANLGVSDLAEGDFDGGIAHLLWAMHEDRGWSTDSIGRIFSDDLYLQFSEGKFTNGRSQFGGVAPWIFLGQAIKRYNTTYSISHVFDEVKDSVEHRALLEGSLWTTVRNLQLLREENKRGIFPSNNNNIYTRLRLFSATADVCRFIELRMSHHESTSDLTLGQLLKKVFGQENWYPSTMPRPRTSTDFDGAVRNALENAARPASSVLTLLAIRNYATHIADPATPYFFEKFERVFEEVIAMYLYYLEYRKLV